jgi:hypothetical protein
MIWRRRHRSCKWHLSYLVDLASTATNVINSKRRRTLLQKRKSQQILEQMAMSPSPNAKSRPSTATLLSPTPTRPSSALPFVSPSPNERPKTSHLEMRPGAVERRWSSLPRPQTTHRPHTSFGKPNLPVAKRGERNLDGGGSDASSYKRASKRWSIRRFFK